MALSRKSKKKAAIHPVDPQPKEEVKRQPSGEDAQLLMEKTEVPGDDTGKNNGGNQADNAAEKLIKEESKDDGEALERQKTKKSTGKKKKKTGK